MRRVCLAVAAVMFAVSCGGNSGNPAGPGSSSNFVIESITAVAERVASGGLRYRVRFRLRETGGVGATVNRVRLEFGTQAITFGGVNVSDPFTPMQIAANGSVTSREFVIDDSGNTVPDRVNIIVDYTTDRGTAGTTTQQGGVTAPGTAPPTPQPPAACTTGPGGTCMSISRFTVTCSDIPPGFEMNCSAQVPVVINTPISSGLIVVNIPVISNSFEARIVTIPNTAPGAMTLQIPLMKLSAGCGKSGIRNELVNVDDGAGANRRALWGTTAEGNFICNR